MMHEPTFDGYDYPTIETLECIINWPFGEDQEGLLRFIGRAWHPAKYWRDDGKTIEAITLGWGPNEHLISAFQKNPVAWAFLWQFSERGGRHVFKRYSYAEEVERSRENELQYQLELKKRKQNLSKENDSLTKLKTKIQGLRCEADAWLQMYEKENEVAAHPVRYISKKLEEMVTKEDDDE